MSLSPTSSTHAKPATLNARTPVVQGQPQHTTPSSLTEKPDQFESSASADESKASRPDAQPAAATLHFSGKPNRKKRNSAAQAEANPQAANAQSTRNRQAVEDTEAVDDTDTDESVEETEDTQPAENTPKGEKPGFLTKTWQHMRHAGAWGLGILSGIGLAVGVPLGLLQMAVGIIVHPLLVTGALTMAVPMLGLLASYLLGRDKKK